MKLLPDNYIFLCIKTVICEIYKYVINDDNENCDFFIISSWVNNKEIISSNVYIFGSKTDIELEDKNISRDNIQYDKNEIVYIDDSINSKNKILDLNQKNENNKKHDKITPKKVTSNDLCKIDCLLVNRNNSDKNNEYCIITLDIDGIFHFFISYVSLCSFTLDVNKFYMRFSSFISNGEPLCGSPLLYCAKLTFYASALPRSWQADFASSSGSSVQITDSCASSAPALLQVSSQVRIHSPSPHP